MFVAETLGSDNMIVLGDLNARVAMPALEDPEGMPYVYKDVADHTLNARGRSILNMCSNNDMVVANHLYYNNRQRGGNLSYKRRHYGYLSWIYVWQNRNVLIRLY